MPNDTSIESDLLSNVPGLNDDTSTGTEATTTTPTQQTGNTQQPTQQPGQRTTQQQTTPQGTATTQTTQQRQPSGRFASDAQHNLIDTGTGQIVARAGAERRLFERAQHAQNEVNHLKSQIGQYEEAFRQLQKAGGIAHELGLEPNEQVAALQMFASWKKDPSGTLKQIVAEAQRAGIQIEGVTPGLDAKVIESLIDKRFGPLLAAFDGHSKQQEAMVHAQRTLEHFIAQAPAANQHLDLISNILQRDPSMSLEQAWMQIMQYAMRNGLDVNQPFPPQLHARNQQRQQPPARQQKPIPSSRGGGVSTQQIGNSGQYDPGSSWKDILAREFDQLS